MFRSFVVFLTVCALGAGFSWAGEAKQVPQWYLDTIVDTPNPVPRGLAPGEVFVPVFRDPDAPNTPPSEPVWTPAEYDDNEGMLISWKAYETLLTQIVVAVTTGTSATMWIAAPASQQAAATSTLIGAGARMDHVEFIAYSTYSVWMRDYGPRFVREGNHRAMVDHTYNRNRPADDAFPDHLAALWGEPQYDIPLTHGGGNFHLYSDASREAFMTELIVDENAGLAEQDIKDYYLEYQGLDLTITDALPTWYDWTQHIDMWMLPVRDREVIIGQYPAGDTQAVAVTEGAVTMLEGRGYTVHRTPGWSIGYNSTHYTYTNSVVFNEIVLACQYQNASPSYADEDGAALAVFETAFPDKQIVPVDCSGIIGQSGAIHCIVMHVPVAVPEIFWDGFETGDLFGWDEVGDE